MLSSLEAVIMGLHALPRQEWLVRILWEELAQPRILPQLEDAVE